MICSSQHEAFSTFVKDHIVHFDSIPLDFEDEHGKIWGYEDVWETASKLGLTELIKH